MAHHIEKFRGFSKIFSCILKLNSQQPISKLNGVGTNIILNNKIIWGL